MHTALVSRILRDRSLWEESTLNEAGLEPAMMPAVSNLTA
jgi:hypothetical protein